MKKLNGSSYTWESLEPRQLTKEQKEKLAKTAVRNIWREPQSDWLSVLTVCIALIITLTVFLILIVQYMILKPLWQAIDTIEAYTDEIASYQRVLPLPTTTPVPTPEPTEAPATPAEDPGLSLPDPKVADGSFKTFLPYNLITKKDSPQLMLQQLAWTDRNGFRRYNHYYLIALGMAYTNTIGETFEVELSSGQTVQCMVGDVKHPKDTDPSMRFVPVNGNIVEFIVDKESLDPEIVSGGNISPLGFQGSITRILPTGYTEVAP